MEKCKECKFCANAKQSQLYSAALLIPWGRKMPRHAQPVIAHSQRSIASAVGVALAAMSVAHMAQAAEPASDNALNLGATNIDGERADTAYKTEESASKKYTAPLRETPKSVTVIPQQVIRDTAATSLADALR